MTRIYVEQSYYEDIVSKIETLHTQCGENLDTARKPLLNIFSNKHDLRIDKTAQGYSVSATDVAGIKVEFSKYANDVKINGDLPLGNHYDAFEVIVQNVNKAYVHYYT